MISELRYSAAMPAAPFIFPESRQIAKLMLEYDEKGIIKQIVHENNILQVKTKRNEEKLFRYAYNRLIVLPDSLKCIIAKGDDSDGRYVNLISIIRYDNLFREFIEEVYFERLINNNPITDYDIMSFFERKGREDANVSSWKYTTVYRLRRLYTRALFEAGLLKAPSGNREICAPYIGQSTIDTLLKEKYGNYIKITLGNK
ncbi:MAG: DUF1819 family protein [Lachnoclostridium sp.]|jgi:hypothetical protein|nr:DUF1819 family protein [Lachnoclostridium sp.]